MVDCNLCIHVGQGGQDIKLVSIDWQQTFCKRLQMFKLSNNYFYSKLLTLTSSQDTAGSSLVLLNPQQLKVVWTFLFKSASTCVQP